MYHRRLGLALASFLHPHLCAMQSSASQAGPSKPSPSTSDVNAGPLAAGKPDRLYVGNLSPTVDEYTLLQIFQKFGKVTKLDFMFHKTGVQKGKPRGYAFIEFANKDVRLASIPSLHLARHPWRATNGANADDRMR